MTIQKRELKLLGRPKLYAAYTRVSLPLSLSTLRTCSWTSYVLHKPQHRCWRPQFTRVERMSVFLLVFLSSFYLFFSVVILSFPSQLGVLKSRSWEGNTDIIGHTKDLNYRGSKSWLNNRQGAVHFAHESNRLISGVGGAWTETGFLVIGSGDAWCRFSAFSLWKSGRG